ncbi:MAG: NapC/NirT family cytochrome c, partial [Thermoanaerobaculia bacterium]
MKLGRFTVAGYAIGLILGIGIVATYGAMHMSSTPGFCGSCHVMSPYYESWAESSHANINCVDCHISPGITQELRKKYEAMAMVARYFTGTYGTNPWAEVDDSACLECHERRLLMGREVFGDVLFDHGPHLSELRRGKRLKCTSCHSQIVQGSHMTVTATTCTLCHFKGQQPGEGTA